MTTLEVYNEFTGDITQFHKGVSNNIWVTQKPRSIQEIAPGIFEERYRVYAKRTTSPSLESVHADIVEAQLHAIAYIEQPERHKPVWIREGADGDTYQRKAVCRSVKLQFFNQFLAPGNVFRGELTFIRHEWEIAIKTTDTASVNLIGGFKKIESYYIAGAIGSRIHELILNNPEINLVDADFDEIWIGIRDKGIGYTVFDPFFELEDGTAGTDTSNNPQTYFEGGDAQTCTFSTETSMVDRVTITINDLTATADYSFFGEYLIILGYQHALDPSSGYMVAQLTGEAVTDGYPVILPKTTINRSNMIELGYIRFPAQTLRNIYNLETVDLGSMGFSIAAERTGGSGSLHLDYIIFMPAERLLKITPQTPASAKGGSVIYHEHPEGASTCYIKSATNVWKESCPYEPHNFRLPGDDCIIVFAANNTNVVHVDPRTFLASFTLEHYPKFDQYDLI